jgi:hypothetical protein
VTTASSALVGVTGRTPTRPQRTFLRALYNTESIRCESQAKPWPKGSPLRGRSCPAANWTWSRPPQWRRMGDRLRASLRAQETQATPIQAFSGDLSAGTRSLGGARDTVTVFGLHSAFPCSVQSASPLLRRSRSQANPSLTSRESARGDGRPSPRLFTGQPGSCPLTISKP